MATSGFGGRSSYQGSQNKAGLLALVAVVVLLIIGLLGALAYQLSQKNGEVAPQKVEQQVAAPIQPSDQVEILVTRQRIEEGTLFLPESMFLVESRKISEVPPGTMLAKDKPLLATRYAKTLINANAPLLQDYVTDVSPVSALQIPPGFRAITITVDSRRGVEGWAKPNSRVDILWTYTDPNGQKKVSTIVRFVKVLSVGGQSAGGPEQRVAVGGETTATLLVEERDAKKIELARTLGELSLSLVSDKEPPKQQENERPVTQAELLGDGPAENKVEESPADGRMYTKDARTGEMVLYELRDGRWKRAQD